MYIVNPLKGKGKALSDLSATHPPISERIRILRSMAGGASFYDYNTAYSAVRSGKSVMGAASLTGAAPVAIRAASVAAVSEPEPTRIERARETSNALWKHSKHKLVNCQCGTKLRVPPNYKHSNIQ